MCGKEFYISQLNLLTEALCERFLKRDRQGNIAAKRQNMCVILQYSVSTMHKDIHGLQGEEYKEMGKIRGWNCRICSWFPVACAALTYPEAEQFRPRCSAWSKGLVLKPEGVGGGVIIVGSRRKIFQGQRMQDFTSPEDDKIHPFEVLSLCSFRLQCAFIWIFQKS